MDIPESPRPRAHSAPQVSLLSTTTSNGGVVTSPCRGNARSMQNGMTTTVPQSMIPHDLRQGSHAPSNRSLRRVPRQRHLSVSSRRESFEMRCCRINVLLVTMQLCLGIAVSALGFYMETLTTTVGVRDSPYWAGIPLLVAGVLGIYFCATDFAAYATSIKAFVVKCVCLVLSVACVFLCMIGSVFTGIHGNRISSATCNTTGVHCQCGFSNDPTAHVFVYESVGSCDLVVTTIKDYLILQCALNAIASGVCFWFVTLLWKSRYQDFHSGLRFFSYSANGAPHPWTDPTQQYVNAHSSPSPITVHRVIQNKKTLTTRETVDAEAQEPLKYEEV